MIHGAKPFLLLLNTQKWLNGSNQKLIISQTLRYGVKFREHIILWIKNGGTLVVEKEKKGKGKGKGKEKEKVSHKAGSSKAGRKK